MEAGWSLPAFILDNGPAVVVPFSLSEFYGHEADDIVCVPVELANYQLPGTVVMTGLFILGISLLMQAIPYITAGAIAVDDSASDAAVSMATVTPNPSPGCSTDNSNGVQIDTTLNVNIGDRRYLLYLPVNYEPDRPAPLVLSYHGGTRTAETQQGLDLLTTTYFNRDYIVVYPNGIGVR